LLYPPYTSITIEIERLWVEGAHQGEGFQWLLNELADSIGDRDESACSHRHFADLE
jgi:hypothetical protein